VPFVPSPGVAAEQQPPTWSSLPSLAHSILELLSKDLSDIIAASPLLTLHRALCEVESISNNENAVGKLVVSYLKAHNFDVTTQEVPQPASSRIKKPRYNM
jgi:acetylornithine deacetylase